MKSFKRFIYFSFLFPILIFSGTGNEPENSLSWILPEDQVIGPSVRTEYMQSAQGKKLVELINGGAVLFFKRGFVQAVFQEYLVDSSNYINLEVYQMAGTEGAKGIFIDRTDNTSDQVLLGNLSSKGKYYYSFYRDNYYVIVTGSDSSKALQQIVLKTAELVDQKIVKINK